MSTIIDPSLPLIAGTPESDVLTGTGKAEIISGLQGDDQIDAGGGGDQLFGGSGNDIIHGGSGDDVIHGGGGPKAIDLEGMVISHDYKGAVTFLSDGAGYKNTLGVYRIAADGSISGVEVIFANASAQGSGGTLVPGVSEVALDLKAGDRLGFFLIPNAYSKSAQNRAFLDNPDTKFIFSNADGTPGNVASGQELVLTAVNPDDGSTHQINGQYGPDSFHTAASADDNYALNGDGLNHTIGFLDPETGAVQFSFEDLKNGGDKDYDDVIFSIDIGKSNAKTLTAAPESLSAPGAVLPAGENDILFGDSGNDKIYGGRGDDQVSGGTGNDLVYGNSGNDILHGDDGNDRIYGGKDDDQLFGDSGKDLLYGNSGNDRLNGGKSDDTLYGNTGDDILHGDDGVDRVYGGRGNDQVFGDSGDDHLKGESGNDLLSGGTGDDELRGNTGNDILHGDDGDDRVYGGKDDDQVFGDAGNDFVKGNSGNDALFGGTGNDTLSGDSGDDRLEGGSGSDNLSGGSGNDVLVDGSGDDKVDGGSGDDMIIASSGTDTYVGGSGIDTIDFSSALRYVKVDLHAHKSSGMGNDTLSGIENVIGSVFDDHITGDKRDNAIDGGAGNDVIRGYTGNDHMTGGEGGDVFVWRKKDIQDIKTKDIYLDRLSDFDENDALDLTGALKNAKPETIDKYLMLKLTGADTEVHINFKGKAKDEFHHFVTIENFEGSLQDMLDDGMLLV